MAAAPKGYDGVVITTPVTVPYTRYSPEGAAWWTGRALAELARGAGLASHREIDGFVYSSFSSAPDSAVGLTQHFGLSPRLVDFVPLGGMGAVASLRRAARAVQMGDAEIVACVAGETNGIHSFRHGLENFSRFSQDGVYPYSSGGPNVSFALMAAQYMATTGATREDFGKLCVAMRYNALRNPNALMKKPLSLDDYLGARPIAPPIHLFDCVQPCAGADGFLVMREETAKAQGLAFARLTGGIERYNGFAEDPIQLRGGWGVDVDTLYAMAGVRPDDIDVVNTYDDYPFVCMLQFEGLGFCAPGEAPEFVRAHEFTFDGSFPHNTSGGQLSVGQAGCAGGHLGVVEVLRQLTGQAGPRQVKDAKLGLVSGFGMINYDRGLGSGAVILEQGSMA
ncbi:thiolase family protein [Pseudodonghicola flavimaris]|uniref:Thiolase family protein n=1 Tax=Pseudodonghicola flavimaris TaxID=3050036 RepID=A0ABT7EY80_9RHOB|nr:thiolase family protein [Pseudodonghicola flavimaris]MDK3017298.1 thiolase family protein [Pseudodonghicola flavimaris]